jgi:hypothetical protein
MILRSEYDWSLSDWRTNLIYARRFRVRRTGGLEASRKFASLSHHGLPTMSSPDMLWM